MKCLIVSGFTSFLAFLFSDPNSFISEQRQFPRVSAAFYNKEAIILSRLKALNVAEKELNILMVAYKTEKQLELYAKKKEDLKYKLLSTYNICALSGRPGPKRKQGDYQMPEGYYYINRFNPESKYHLSLGLNYPNQSDRILSDAAKPGGDIFIHGKCVTIGCLPMTDDIMEELYLYTIQAHNNGQEQIPVYIFPFRLSSTNLAYYSQRFNASPALEAFWNNLKTGYTTFNLTNEPLTVEVNEKGKYLYK